MQFQKTALLVLFLTVQSTNVFTQQQKMEHKVEKAKTLGKDSIIDLAKSIYLEKYPDSKINYHDYEITVWANSKTIVVDFKRRLKFIPLGKVKHDLNYDLSVNIETKEVETDHLHHSGQWYVPTTEDSEKIEFIKHLLKLPRPGFDNTIIELEDGYEIMIDNEVAFGRYYVDKATGKELTELSIEGSYSPPPFLENTNNPDPLVEIQ